VLEGSAVVSGVVFVVGLCALAFALGCLLTSVVLRRDREQPPPQAAPTPSTTDRSTDRLTDRFAPMIDLGRLPADYATRPIHRNPVVGIPPALPPSEPSRPKLSLVPDPEPDLEPEEPVRQDEVRHMHVVRDLPRQAVDTPKPAMGGEPALGN
jgi:hypothetical protein